MRSRLSLCAVLLLTSGLPALAGESSGWVGAARVGLVQGLGRFSNERDAASLGSTLGTRAALALEAGYRFGPRVSAGLLGQTTPGGLSLALSTIEPDDAVMSAGAFASVHLAPTSFGDPWVGLVAGWAWARYRVSVDGSPVSVSHAGPQVGLQAGLALLSAPRLSVGLFLSATAGTFTREAASFAGRSAAEPVRLPGPHLWAVAGVRFQFTAFEHQLRPEDQEDPLRQLSAPGVQLLDAALREMQAAERLLGLGRTLLAREKLERAVARAGEGLVWLEDPRTESARPLRYRSKEVGVLTPAELSTRLEAVRAEARRKLEALPVPPLEGASAPGA